MYDFVKFLVSSVKIAAVLHKFYSSLVVVVVKSPIRITGSNVRTVSQSDSRLIAILVLKLLIKRSSCGAAGVLCLCEENFEMIES